MNVAQARTSFICTRGLGCSESLGGPGHRELGDFLTVTIDNGGTSLIAFDVPGGVRVAKQN